MYKVSEILAHQNDMILIDRIQDFDDQSMTAELMVNGKGLFGDEHSIPAWIGIEYMAQTVAAHGGLMCKLSGKPINMGFLLGTRKFISNVSEFRAGTLLSVSVKKVIQDQGLGVFDCKITGEGIEVSANLNVYQPDQAINKIIKE